MGEVFQVVFISQTGGNVINNASLVAVSYNVNWVAILPQKNKKFSCRFTVKSQPNPSLLNNTGIVSMNFGRVNTYDGLQHTHVLGVIAPIMLSTTQTGQTAAIVANPAAVPPILAVPAFSGVTLSSRYESNVNDNNEVWIDYPTNPIVTINFKSLTGVALPSMQHYLLILTLTGIDDI